MGKTIFVAKNVSHENGAASVGTVEGEGIAIQFKALFEAEGMDETHKNGTTVKSVLAACEQRLIFEMDHGTRSRENALALTKIQEASHWLSHGPLVREGNQAAPEGSELKVEGPVKV
jgi:hypothetical protein